MSSLKEQFQKAADEVLSLATRPDNSTLLDLYALYKQGSVGDVAGDKPGITRFKERAKWEAWAKLKGCSTEQAMQKYIALVAKLKGQ